MKSNFPAFHRRFAEDGSSRQNSVITRYKIYSAWQPFSLLSVTFYVGIVVFGAVADG